MNTIMYDSSMNELNRVADCEKQRKQSQAVWDLYYLGLAKYVASKSKDPSTQTGAVIVSSDKSLISSGFNGFPMCMPDLPELYANREEKYSRIVHCEMNAVILAKTSVRGGTLYTWPFASCDRCAVHMLQAGIVRFVYPKLPPEKAERWGDALTKTLKYFKECNVEWQEYEFD
jgi:dCMP deaminase